MKIIKLEQPNCNPCNMVSNYLEDKNVEFQSIDVTENPDVAAKYGVMGVPVVILLDGEGNEVQRSKGYNPPELESIVSQL